MSFNDEYFHDDSYYLPLIEGRNTNDDMCILERGVLTTKIKLLMVDYKNVHSAPNKNMACMEQIFINISVYGDNVVLMKSRNLVLKFREIEPSRLIPKL